MSLLLTFLFVQRGNTNIMSGSVGKVSYCNICRLCNKDYLSVARCFIEEDNEGADHQSCCLYSDCPTLRIQSESREDTRTAWRPLNQSVLWRPRLVTLTRMSRDPSSHLHHQPHTYHSHWANSPPSAGDVLSWREVSMGVTVEHFFILLCWSLNENQ